MAYRIEYGKPPRCARRNRATGWRKGLLVSGIVVAGAVAALYIINHVDLRNLLPGDPVVTGTALDTMVESLRSGIPVGEAFSAFCEEIVTHALFFE